MAKLLDGGRSEEEGKQPIGMPRNVNTPAAAGLYLHDVHTDPYTVARHFMTHYIDPKSGRANVIRPESYADKAIGVTHLRPPNSLLRVLFPPSNYLHSSNCANVPPFDSSGPVNLDIDPWGPLLAFLASALPENHPELTLVLDNVDKHARKMVMAPETHLLGDHSTLGTSLNNVPGAVSEVKARLVWVQVPSENGVHLDLMHRFEVEMEHDWYETTVSERPPNLGVFVPPGSNFDTMSSAPGLGRGPRLGKALAGQKPKKGCHAKEEGTFAAIPTLTQYPALFSCRSSSPPSNPGPPKFSKATYEVFPWRVNDPVEAVQRKAEGHEAEHPLSYGRETVKELGDSLPSPAGWHTLPVSWDLSVEESDRAGMGDSFWRTTNTTWGNNVFAHENWDGRNAWMYNRRRFHRSRCRVYFGNTAPPYPDRDMRAPINSGRFGWGESGDFITTPVRSASTHSNYAMGASPPTTKVVSVTTFTPWTSLSTPRPTKPLDKPGYWSIRAIEEEMLWVVQQRLIATYGFSESLLPPVPTRTDPSHLTSTDPKRSTHSPANPILTYHSS
ncbi:hypothetical protein PAXINDRAFT_8166 [Paxillus involutus ATCC 200175]|nr:hypothetical protein PAXINDRAFT_8166 [Paxillus involutus ATCC 200175]